MFKRRRKMDIDEKLLLVKAKMLSNNMVGLAHDENGKVFASEVILCKDCKYYTQFGCKPTHIDENNEDVTLAMEDDDFCSRGEKR